MINDKKGDIPLIENPQILHGVNLGEVITVMTDNEFKLYEKLKAEEASKNIKNFE